MFVVAATRAAEVVSVDMLYGSYKMTVLYNPAKPFPSRTLHATTEGSTMYVDAVRDGISRHVVVRRIVTKQIPVTPRGCDAKSPLLAVVDHLCEFGGQLALQSVQILTEDQWSLRADSPQCVDKAGCFGPVYCTSEKWTPDEIIADVDLLQSRRGVFVVSNAGHAGEIPMTTFVPIQMPRLAIWSSCAGYEDVEFELTAKDNYNASYTNATYVYGSGLVRRLRFERAGRNQFRVVLGTKGGDSFYTDSYVSVDTYSSVEEVIDSRVQFDVQVPPTPGPTALPTQTPTMAPDTTYGPTTLWPTLTPTLTARPTTYAPSLSPSHAPTLLPTGQPTLGPTLVPTGQPTLAPSLAPTSTPRPTTPGPTSRPTTRAPSQSPTITAQPSLTPTSSPSLAPTNSPSTVCAAEITLVAAPKPFRMIKPVVPDDLTYPLDVRGSFLTAECSYVRGGLDANGDLVVPDCPRNALCGGYVWHRAPGPFGAKYRVRPDAKFADYVEGCMKYYPKAAEFLGLRGSSAVRDQPDLHACNAPFPLPQRVVDKDYDVFEKLRQCKMLGGRGALETVDYCTMDVTTTLCRAGWYFFDEFCYYRPNPEKDGQYKTRQEDADAVCSSLHPKAKAANSIDEYTEAWLQTSFVFQNPITCGTDPVRALVTGTRCKCYDCQSTNSSESGVVTECGCETPTFPLCVYKAKDDYIAWNDMKFHPSTLRVLRDGQCMDRQPNGDATCMGNERYGRELECKCIPGSAGQYCERRACIANASTLVGEGLLLKFAQVCEKHGFCDEGQVDVCKCKPGYGPPSTFGDALSAFACSLPMTKVPRDPESGFVVDGVHYDLPYGVCNGASAGEGVCDPVTGICVCKCKTRVNMDPDGEGVEPAYDGIGCTARVPMLPANGYQNNDGIVERLCNGRGTACPHGERLGEKRLDGTYVVTVDSDFCRGKPDTCICDNGFTGHACTVPTPFDDAARKPTFFEHGAYVPVRGGRRTVMNVYVKPEAAYAGVVPTCGANKVYVSDTTLKSDTLCIETSDEGRWWCNGAYGTYVVINTTELRPSCSIEIYTENHAPCGNFTNPRMPRRFANAVYRGWNRTDEFQSQAYGKYGGTTTECACDENHTGPLCRHRISSKRYDPDGVVSNHVCGEGTQPPRGKPGPNGCDCFFVAGLDFAGSVACQCATDTNGKLCGGVGTCVDPKYARGVCEFDKEDEANDMMSTPFTQVAPPDSVRKSVYRVSSKSVFEFEGESWIVYEGQTFEIETLKGNVSICHDNARYPLNITHECGQPVDVASPARAIANVTVFGVDEYETNYSTLCDPAFSCPTTRYCSSTGELPCLTVNEWMEDPDESNVLVSKRYVSSRATCVEASPVRTQIETEFPYGVFPTCSDPVYRFLDESLEGVGYVPERQCKDGFGIFDNVKGQIFGVFDNVIPGLNFRSTWTDAHYLFLASLMNDGVCEDPLTGKYVEDALHDGIVHAYGMSLVRVAPEDVVELGEPGEGDLLYTSFNSTLLTRDAPAWWGNAYWHVGTSLPFGPTTRWGGWLYLPKGQGEVRKITIRNGGTTNVTSFSIVGPRGEVCVTYLKIFQPNETFTVDCGSSFETESAAESLYRLWINNHTELANDMINEWPSPYVLLYSATEAVQWRESDVGYASRSVSYTDRWRSLSAQIIGRKTFPYNEPFETECSRLGGYVRPVNLTLDKAFLRQVHDAHLGRPECTQDHECKRFARGPNYRCVPENTVGVRGWYNGDPLTENAVVGRDGGCFYDNSTQLMDPQFHGTRCTAGYEAPWVDALDFELLASANMRNVSGWTEPFVLLNASQWDADFPECTLPSSTSAGRPTSACGGARGTLRRDAYVRNTNVTVYDGDKIKRCAAVRISSGEVLYAHENELELDLHSFGEYRVNVIQGSVWVDGVETSEIACIERTDSATHRVLSFFGGGGASVTTIRRDAWTDFIVA